MPQSIKDAIRTASTNNPDMKEFAYIIEKADRRAYGNDNIDGEDIYTAALEDFRKIVRAEVIEQNEGKRYNTGFNEMLDEAVNAAAPRRTAEFFAKYGIKGIAYDGAQDGPAFVVFDERDVKVVERAKYSISGDEEGAYVVADTAQDLFEGKTVDEMRKIAHNEILKRFKNKVIGAENQAYVNKGTANEYSYSANQRVSEENKKAKYRVSPELDNLMSVAEFASHEDDGGGHPDAVRGWDYYNARFDVGGKMFSGQIAVKLTSRGDVFYDVTKIKSVSAVRAGDNQLNGSPASDGNASADSIRSPGGDVNGKFSADGDADAADERRYAARAEMDAQPGNSTYWTEERLAAGEA
jgi:hypothetical protein